MPHRRAAAASANVACADLAPCRPVTSVAVLGGGVGGLSAAHELAERGFDVTVYEARDEFGGKARSMPVPGSGTGGRADLPAEHGFRFFPGFYRHLPDTMARIPHGGGSAADHLVPATRILLAQAGGRDELVAAARAPSSLDDLAVLVRFAWEFGAGAGIPPPELALFVERLLTLLTSCDERRLDQWERSSWWDYIGAPRRSAAFQKFLADGLTRTLVAARAREISARTGGLILCQLLFDLTRAGGRADRVLDAPTSEAWIDPWVAHLRTLGVTFRGGCEVAGIECDGRRIRGVTVQGAAGPERIVADHYVAALPVERLRLLLSPTLRAAEPRLAALPRLVVRWMNGVMFYLDRDVRAPARARDLHRLRVGADGDLAGAVLARRRPRAARRRARRGDPLGRRLGVGAARTAHGQGRDGVHARGDPRGGLGAARRPHRRRLARRSATCSPGSSTPRSSSPTRPARPTSSRC